MQDCSAGFYDAHVHAPSEESGGFLIGLEGTPWFDGILHNEEVERIAAERPQYKAFHYVTNAALMERTVQPLLKYHPRRERYTPDEVIESIRCLGPRAVMIDTLNEPFWTPYDYWKVCRAFPQLKFILPHAGGYLISDFIKICHFQPNVWIDFALTHTHFASISSNPLAYVDDAIRYSLSASFSNRVLMGSDYPFFDQQNVVKYYEKLGKLDMLNENFKSLFASL